MNSRRPCCSVFTQKLNNKLVSLRNYFNVQAGLSAESAPYLNIKYTVNGENFNYFYNLADMFNGAETTNVKFCEGWQNNLTINIGMAEINFDADVYKWSTKESGSFDVD